MCSRLGDDLQHLEDGLQTKEDDLDMMKDDETCYFLSINKDWLNPFKCSETIGNYEGKRYMTLVSWTTDYRWWPTDYGRWPRYIGRCSKISCFLQINKNSLNPFKYPEMILNYKLEDDRWGQLDGGWTTDYRRWPTDYGRWPNYDGRWPKFSSSK